MIKLIGEKRFYLIAVLLFAISVAIRLASYFHGSLLDGEMVIPAQEPDVFYHMKRIVSIFSGNFDLLFRDDTLNFPCPFVPPWPWGFDSFVASCLRALNIFNSPTRSMLFAQASGMVIGIGVLQMLALLGFVRRCDTNRWVAVMVAWGISFSTPFLRDAHFGAIDNQIADTFLVIVVLLSISNQLLRRYSTLSAVCLVIAMSMSDVSLLLLALLLTGHCLCLLMGRVENMAEDRAFFYKSAIGGVVFLVLEYALGLERSYSAVRFLIIGGIGALVLFAFFVESKLVRSFVSRVVLALVLGLLLVFLALKTQMSTLVFFLSGNDGITGQIVEATPAWHFFSPEIYIAHLVLLAFGCFFLLRSPLNLLSKVQGLSIFAVGFILFSLQVKFSFMLLAPTAIGIAGLVSISVNRIRLPYRLTRPIAISSQFSMVLLFVASGFYRGAGYVHEPTELTKAVQAAALALNAVKGDSDCRVITAPSFGTAFNYLTSCRVSSSTFWGNPCSKELYMASVRACSGEGKFIETFHSKLNFRYLVVEIPTREEATLKRLQPLTLFKREYVSSKSPEPLILLLIDLNLRKKVA